VPVLRRSLGVRGDGDLPDAQPVAGGAAILQDPHPHRAGQHLLATIGADH
jgi:hypothetical protein